MDVYIYLTNALVFMIIFVTADRWCVMLKSGPSDYLHATLASGYKRRRAFILAQTPLPATLRPLWTAIFERRVAVVVQLTAVEEDGQEVCTIYWPTEVGEVMEFTGYSVELIEEEHLNDIIIRTLSVLECKVSRVEMEGSMGRLETTT